MNIDIYSHINKQMIWAIFIIMDTLFCEHNDIYFTVTGTTGSRTLSGASSRSSSTASLTSTLLKSIQQSASVFNIADNHFVLDNSESEDGTVTSEFCFIAYVGHAGKTSDKATANVRYI